MKNFYKLLNYEFITFLKPMIFLCLGVIITPIIFVSIAMKDYSNVYQRFETIYASSGAIIIFLIYFAVLCGLCLKSIYSNYWGSKSIYTLMTLPVKREAIYFSKLCTFIICFLMLIASQLISVFICYFHVSSVVANVEEGKYLMTNGLFLTFVRSEFLRIILPLGAESIISSLSIFITILCSLYYGALCERSKKYWGFALIILSALIIVFVLSYRINQAMDINNYHNMYIYSGILFSLSVFFIWHSIKFIKKGAPA